jgi:hypothetical protein
MRETCLDCTRKHLAQAMSLAIKRYVKIENTDPFIELGQAKILLDEFKTGDYPLHLWFAIGHIAIVENMYLNSQNDNKEQVADLLRDVRIKTMEVENYYPDVNELLDRIRAIDGNMPELNLKDSVLDIKGHLNEAIEECSKLYPELARNIAEHFNAAISGQADWAEINYPAFIEMATELAFEENEK